MKPRLKLTLRGRIEVLEPGFNGWDEFAAHYFLRQHYGSIKAFAQRFGLSETNTYDAIRWAGTERKAGETGRIRQILGLRSVPSKTSLALVESHARRAAGGRS